jgi:invasion protein IalB
VFRLTIIVALAWLSFASAAVAQTSQSTTATYDAWVVRCDKGAQGSVCEMTQTTQLKDSNQIVSLIAIGAAKGNGTTQVVFQVPTNVWLQPGITLAGNDGQTAIASNFTRCAPAGCFAETEISQSVLQKLRAMKEQGSLRFKDASQKDVVIPVSFKGFTQAYDAMSKQSTAGR